MKKKVNSSAFVYDSDSDTATLKLDLFGISSEDEKEVVEVNLPTSAMHKECLSLPLENWKSLQR